MELKKIVNKGREYFLPNLSIDLVVIGYINEKLMCLLLRVSDKWMLPGGFIGKDESVDQAAKRILTERSDIEQPHLKFLAVFGDKKRKFSDQLNEILRILKQKWTKDNWLNKRFVTLVYYSLVDIKSTIPKSTGNDEEILWHDVNDLPKMWFDHKPIVKAALKALRNDIKFEHISHHLLPEEFTMPELHKLHEVIL